MYKVPQLKNGEVLICYCKKEDESPDSSKHIAKIDRNNEVVIECQACLRAIKSPMDNIVAVLEPVFTT